MYTKGREINQRIFREYSMILNTFLQAGACRSNAPNLLQMFNSRTSERFGEHVC